MTLGSDWSVPECQVEGCVYCAHVSGQTCPTCEGPITHQPERPERPDLRHLLVCPRCGYDVVPGWNGNLMPTTITVSPDGRGWEVDHPDYLALRLLKGEEVVTEDHPPEFCALPSCDQRVDRWVRRPVPPELVDKIRDLGFRMAETSDGGWEASIPLCGLHGYEGWYPSITPEGISFERVGPARS